MPEWLRKWMGDSFHRLGFDKEVEPIILAPEELMQRLREKLEAMKIPIVMLLLPQTDHSF